MSMRAPYRGQEWRAFRDDYTINQVVVRIAVVEHDGSVNLLMRLICVLFLQLSIDQWRFVSARVDRGLFLFFIFTQ